MRKRDGESGRSRGRKREGGEGKGEDDTKEEEGTQRAGK